MQSVEYPQSEFQESHDMYQAQPPYDEGSQQNGTGNPYLGNNIMAPGAKPESQGTGIKEDG